MVIDLEITFEFFEPADEVAAGDDYQIVGEEQVVDLRSSVGFDSFLSTIAAAVNAAAAVVEARPGLLSMGDLPARSVAAKGERRAARTSLGARLLRTETETQKMENLLLAVFTRLAEEMPVAVELLDGNESLGRVPSMP